MGRPYTAVEVENRTAFLVQLHAVLAQIGVVVKEAGVNSASKAKLADLRNGTEEWLAEVGDVASPRPPVVAVVPAPAPPEGNTSSSPTEEVPAVEEGESSASSPTPAAPTEAALPEQAPPSRVASPVAGGEFTDVTASMVGSKSIAQLVQFMGLLYTSGLPESAKLRALAKGLVRLVVVRCASTLKAALLHVVQQTYAPSPQTLSKEAGMECFVLLGRDIRLSAQALQGCLDLVTYNCELSDPGAIRFPLQICVDALKELRRSMQSFQARIEKEELTLLRIHQSVSHTADSSNHHHRPPQSRDGDARNEDGTATGGDTEAERAVPAQYVSSRVKELEKAWGPSLLHAITHIGDALSPAVAFLVSVASIKEVGAPVGMATLKLDAQSDLFALCGCFSSSASPPSAAAAATSTSAKSQGGRSVESNTLKENGSVTALGTPSTASLMATASERPTPRHLDDKAAETELSASVLPPSASSGVPAQWRASVSTVLPRLGVSFAADYIAAVAECSGDESDGRLVATRILSDGLRELATNDVALLRCLTSGPLRWRTRLFLGVLNCLVSLQPAVLSAGLADLHVIVTSCSDVLGNEVGCLYGNCLFRLLESENSPYYVKLEVLRHFLKTFLRHPRSGGGATEEVPTLLKLYTSYDLNQHAHQLNIVQQLISAFSRIVRRTPRQDIIHDVTVQQQLLQQLQKQPPSSTDLLAASTTSQQEWAAMQQSLPLIALHGLVQSVEIVSTQAPPENDAGKDNLTQLRPIPNRERKLEEQRLVDVFNNSPKRGIAKMFAVTDEEMNPPGSEAFLTACEHSQLPAPANEVVQGKVNAVVNFLRSTQSLSPESVSEYMTTPAVFSLQVCSAYMDRLALAGCGLVDALKELLSTVQLPKEGQRIERLLEYFCGAYFRANNVPGVDRTVFPFETEDACFVMVVATVMLNTNLHNPLAGVRLTQTSFRAQLRGCNNEKDFPDTFVDDAYLSISRHPLDNVKSIGAASLEGNTHNSTAGAEAPIRGIDMLFISAEERRQLAYGIERQRLVTETKVLLLRRFDDTVTLPPDNDAWWCAAARDYFLSTWSSVCAVFGPAMYEEASAPEEVLVKCIRGLQALLFVAASFALSTECEVTLLALLRMCVYDTVKEMCRSAVLSVAASAYAVHFSPRCWLLVFRLLVQLKKENNAMPAMVESVLARVEMFTRVSCEGDTTAAAMATAGPSSSGSAADVAPASPALPDAPTAAVRRILEGLMELLKEQPLNDGPNLTVCLQLLKRALGYSLITHTGSGSGVANFVNVRDFSHLVLPVVVGLATRHRDSEESLQAMMDFAVDLLSTMWSSYSSRRYERPGGSNTGARTSGDGAADLEERPCYITVDSAPPELVDCYDFFRMCYAGNPQSTLLKMHLLQGVKELTSRTLRTVEVGARVGEQCHLALYTILSVWRRVLYPLGRALSDRETAAPEVSRYAILVLQKLVVLGCGTGSTAASAVPARIRGAVLVLLANVAYIGGMCSDIDSAQSCLSHLSTICAAALHLESAIGADSLTELGSPVSDLSVPNQTDQAGVPNMWPRNQPDKLIHLLIVGMDEQPHFVVMHVLERLCLLLRCDRDQTRTETIERLRTLVMQFQPSQVRYLAVLMCDVVLEGTVGRATPHYEVPLSDPSLVSFWLLQMAVPPTMRRCSRTAFRSTLPTALGFLTNDLLAAAPLVQLGSIAQLLMERCLVPILVSPNCGVFQSRSLAARSLKQCIMACLARHTSNPAACSFPMQSTLNCVCLVLFTVRVPLWGVVPPETPFCGRDWLAVNGAATISDGGTADSVTSYEERATAALQHLAVANPRDVTGNRHAASFSLGKGTPDGGDGVADVSSAGAIEANGEAETSAADPAVSSSATPSPSISTRSRKPGHKAALPALYREWRQNGTASEIASDDQLIEYITFLVQVLSGLPKVLSSCPAAVSSAASETAAASAASVSDPTSAPSSLAHWAPPMAGNGVLLHYLLEAAAMLFATLWRVNHSNEMEHYYSRRVEKGREAPPVVKNSGLLPHAAVRGTLNSYLELALQTPSYPLSTVLKVVVDVLGGISTVQTAVQPAGATGATSLKSTPPVSGSTSAAEAAAATAAEMAAMQRLSPQEQQHIRSCNVGMYQELSVVLGHWMGLLQQQQQQQHQQGQLLTANPSLSASRRQMITRAALHPSLFTALVKLLTPTAGPLILTVRDYFDWYISHLPPSLASEDAAVAEENKEELMGGDELTNAGRGDALGDPPDGLNSVVDVLSKDITMEETMNEEGAPSQQVLAVTAPPVAVEDEAVNLL